MQLVHCNLLLNQDRNFSIPKTDVSVAEVVLLRLIHGPDSVIDITPSRMTTTSLPEARAALLAAYGDANKDRAKLIDAMFANIHMQGLTKLSHIVAGAAAAEGKKGAAKGISSADLAGTPGADPED